ncbi:MAG: acyl carrier protein [Opitutaceae bacterium]
MPANDPTPEKICQLIGATFGLTVTEVTPDTALFSNGRLDSFNMIELLGRLEAECGVKIGSGEVSLENLDTAQRIAAFLRRKRRAA